MAVEFFVDDNFDIAALSNSEELTDLIFRYDPIIVGLDDFQAVLSLSRLFFQNEKQAPPEIIKTLTDEIKIYRLSADLVNKIASFERGEMNDWARLWREDKYWKELGYAGMGIWSNLYFIHDLSRISVNENKNLYVAVENQ